MKITLVLCEWQCYSFPCWGGCFFSPFPTVVSVNKKWSGKFNHCYKSIWIIRTKNILQWNSDSVGIVRWIVYEEFLNAAFFFPSCNQLYGILLFISDEITWWALNCFCALKLIKIISVLLFKILVCYSFDPSWWQF